MRVCGEGVWGGCVVRVCGEGVWEGCVGRVCGEGVWGCVVRGEEKSPMLYNVSLLRQQRFVLLLTWWSTAGLSLALDQEHTLQQIGIDEQTDRQTVKGHSRIVLHSYSYYTPKSELRCKLCTATHPAGQPRQGHPVRPPLA